jgi:hypothetical protein
MKPFRPQLRTIIKWNTLLLQDRLRHDRNRWRPIARLNTYKPHRPRYMQKLCVRYRRLKIQFARGIDMMKPFIDVFPPNNLAAIPILNHQMNNWKIDYKDPYKSVIWSDKFTFYQPIEKRTAALRNKLVPLKKKYKKRKIR